MFVRSSRGVARWGAISLLCAALAACDSSGSSANPSGAPEGGPLLDSGVDVKAPGTGGASNASHDPSPGSQSGGMVNNGGAGHATGGADAASGGAPGADTDSGAPDGATDAGSDGDASTGIVGKDGGSVSDATGTITLTFAPGVLLGDTQYTFTPVSTMDGLPTGYTLIAGTAFRVDWTGAGVAKDQNVEVTIRHAAPQPLPIVPGSTPGDLLESPPDPDESPVLNCTGFITPLSPEEVSDNGTRYRFTGVCAWGDSQGGGTPSSGSFTTGLAIPPSTNPPPTVPVITTQPSDAGGDPGGSAVFSLNANGASPLTYQWLRNGSPIDTTDPRYSLSGCTQDDSYCWLTVSSLQSSDDGAVFKAVVKNDLGSTTSDPVILKVCNTGTLTVTDLTLPGPTGGVGEELPERLVSGPQGFLWYIYAQSGTNQSALGQVSTTGMFKTIGISQPSNITVGADGNLWFLSQIQRSNKINVGNITASGALNAYQVLGSPFGAFTSGGGYVWYVNNSATSSTGTSQNDSISRVDTTGHVTDFPSGHPALQEFIWAPDQTLWFTASPLQGVGGGLFSLNPASGAVSAVSIAGVPDVPSAMLADNQGNIWYGTGSAILRIHVESHQVDRFPVCGNAKPMAFDKAGNLWLIYPADLNAFPPVCGRIGRLKSTGDVIDYQVNDCIPAGLVAGPDADLWFMEGGAHKLGHFTPP